MRSKFMLQKKIAVFAMVLLLGWTVIPPASIHVGAAGSGSDDSIFEQGDGTSGSPYEISTAEQLDAVRDELGAYYVLMNNIDLGEFLADKGTEGWEPIGPDNFTGTFDGQGFTISNLMINRTELDDLQIGLFGLVDGATIENVTLRNVVISGHGSVGGIAGSSYESKISNTSVMGIVRGHSAVGGLVGESYHDTIIMNSYAMGDVTGENVQVGGLVGFNSGSKIKDSFATGNVTIIQTDVAANGNAVGGLVGSNDHGEIKGSSATGDVTSNVNDKGHAIGGLVGTNSGLVSTSYARGDVTGIKGVGGLVGENSNEISTSFAFGSVDGEEEVGGLVGDNEPLGSLGEVSNSYYNSAQKKNDLGNAVTEEEMKQRSTYEDWDFANDWYLYNGESLPFLQWYSPYESLGVEIGSTQLDIGDEDYLTVTAHHLHDAYDVDAEPGLTYKVTEGIDIVDIDEKGKVTAKAVGEASLSATLNGKTGTITVKVNGYKITNVEQLSDREVPNGTDMNEIDLPEQVEVTLSNGETEIVKVSWGDGERAYDGNTPGTYSLIGTITELPENVENVDNLGATVDVTVGDPFITGIRELDDINIDHGTDRENINLPEEVGVTLSNGETITVAVNWDEGAPTYDGNESGTYAFVGTLSGLPNDVNNPDDITTTVNVIVEEAPITEENDVDENEIDVEDEDDSVIDVVEPDSDQGEKLPETATPYYNIFLAGLLILTIGGILFILKRGRKKQLINRD